VSPRIITIPEADGTSITIQSLVNQIRDWEDEQANLSYPYLLIASGKEVLDESTKVGITAVLINTKLKFADRTSPTDCDIYGGNLVAVDVDGYPINAVEYAENVTVTIAKSSSATLVETGTSGLTEEESIQLLSITNKPTLTQIESSSILAKENTVSSRASQSSVDSKPSLTQIESSLILAKEASFIETQAQISEVQYQASDIQDTVDPIKSKTDNIPDIPADEVSVQSIIEAIGSPESTVFEHLGSIQTKTNALPATPADESTLTGIKGSGWTDETLKTIKELVESIKKGRISVR